MTLTPEAVKTIAGNSQSLWQAVQTSKGQDAVKMYRYEKRSDGTLTDEIIEMRLPAKDVIRYLARGFKLSRQELMTGKGQVLGDAPVKLYACEFADCEKEFPSKQALSMHKVAAHRKNKPVE